ncbi:MAG: protein translocase subunit SecF [Patescibacteria group bacterium]
MYVIKTRIFWYALSLVLLVGSLISVGVFGMKLGIDFTGGSILSLRFQNRPSNADIERVIAKDDTGGIVIQPVGEKDMNIRMQAVGEDAHQRVLADIKSAYNGTEELSFNSIGPTIGAELRGKSLEALLISFAAILLYIAYSFRGVSGPVQNWKYGIVTLVAALHDAILPIGIFSILGRFAGFEVDTTFVVAILTILGYSINDTIVVLDRVRENLRRTSGSFDQIVGASLKQTYVRSINTSMATLLALVAIFFFGGSTLKPFSLALIIGLISGTYSSIFIASPLLVTWQKWNKKK